MSAELRPSRIPTKDNERQFTPISRRERAERYVAAKKAHVSKSSALHRTDASSIFLTDRSFRCNLIYYQRARADKRKFPSFSSNLREYIRMFDRLLLSGIRIRVSVLCPVLSALVLPALCLIAQPAGSRKQSEAEPIERTGHF